MKILISGGTHGGEPTGVEVVEAIQKKPIPGVNPLIINKLAVKEGSRFIDYDTNRMFNKEIPEGHEKSIRDSIIKKIDGYDLMLDIHNTHSPDMACLITVEEEVSELAHNIASHFELDFILHIPSENNLVSAFKGNGFGIEVSNNLTSKFSTEFIVSKIKKIKILKDSVKLPVYKFCEGVKNESSDINNFDFVDERIALFAGETSYEFDYLLFDVIS